MSIFRRISNLFSRSDLAREIDAELASHIELRVGDSIANGMSAEEARREALIRFGNPTRIKEDVTGMDAALMIDGLWSDIRYAFRQLRKNPGFTATAVITLALGIGVNTAIFTVVHAVLLKNLPVVDPKSLVRLGDDSEDCCNLSLAAISDSFSIFSTDGYRYLRDHATEFEELAAMEAGLSDLSVRRASGGGSPHFGLGEFVSGNYFQTFGVQPIAGRALAPQDDADGAAPVAVLSYLAWQRDYAGDPSVVGSCFIMNTHPITIIGVAPRAFYGDRLTDSPPDFYLPISMEPTLGFFAARNNKEVGWLFLIGRLRPGVAIGPLQEKLSVLLRQSLSELPGFTSQHGLAALAKARVVLTPGGAGVAHMQRKRADSLHLLMELTALVLLIACANIANLTLVRGIARRTETSIRMALGAARRRVIRQLVTESLVLACLGGLAGFALAFGGTRALLALMFPDSPNLTIHATPSLAVLGFTFGISLLTGLIFGIAPAWITSREQPANAMRGVNRSTAGGGSLLQRSLVVLQTALSVVLLVGAGLTGLSLSKMEHQDFGLETENRVVVNMNPLKAGYKPEQLQGLYQRIEDSFRAMPEVKQIGLTLYSPLEGTVWSFWVYPQGHRPPDPGHEVTALFNRASPDYFKAVGQRLVRGRTFTAADTPISANVAVVNEAFAKKLFRPHEDPIGQHFGTEIKSSGDFEIVGVVADSRYEDAREAARPMYFVPMLQQSRTNPPKGLDGSLYGGAFVLQVKQITPGLEQKIRNTLAGIDPNLTVDQYRTLDAQIQGNFNNERFIARLTLLFGILALVLASVGLYGVTTYTVERRTAEIGVRMALGAERKNVVMMVLRGAMMQTAVGLAIGIPAALLCTRFVKAQLYGVAVSNLGVFLAATCALALAALIAGLIPARRAASINPVQALRTE